MTLFFTVYRVCNHWFQFGLGGKSHHWTHVFLALDNWKLIGFGHFRCTCTVNTHVILGTHVLRYTTVIDHLFECIWWPSDWLMGQNWLLDPRAHDDINKTMTSSRVLAWSHRVCVYWVIIVKLNFDLSVPICTWAKVGNTEVGPTSCFGDLVAITVYSHMYLNFKLVLDPSGEWPLVGPIRRTASSWIHPENGL